MIRTIAPAKINWTLEVLGRRDDGYHEVRTLLQTIDLRDELWFEEAESISLLVDGDTVPPDEQLVTKAALLLSLTVGSDEGCAMTLSKRLPVAAGLGGGSSDAAATLRALDTLWELGLGGERLAALAADLGSDVPFFLHGGTALASGRGEVIEPLPDVPERWFVLFLPPLSPPDKTRRMYASLSPSDFTDGARTGALVSHLRAGGRLEGATLCNAFERAAFETFPGLDDYRSRLLQAGAPAVHLAGAGPALFMLAEDEPQAREVASRLGETDARVFVARTLTAAEATRIYRD